MKIAVKDVSFARHARIHTRLISIASAALVAGAVHTSVFAQNVPAKAADEPAKTTDEATQLDEVIVTGTLIRGVEPVGTQAVNVDEQDIRRTGATSTNGVLASVPLISNAFNTNAANTTDAGLSIYRPNIRNLGAAGGNTTLILLDGRNVVGAGILQTTPDASFIPPGMLERIEVLADGGSSLYGSDAVGGIVNYITKRKQDGLQFDGAYGFTKEGYQTDSLNLTYGGSWDRGSFVVSALTRSNSALSTYERDFPRQNTSAYGGSDLRSTACSTPTITVGTDVYRYEDGTFSPGPARCEANLFASIVPKERQNVLYGSLTQELRDGIDLELTAYYSNRRTTALLAQSTATLVIPESNFYFQAVGDETSQNAAFSYAPAFGNSRRSDSEIEILGLSPVVTFELGHDWQMRAMYNYGRSDSTAGVGGQVNAAAQTAAAQGTTAETALNPYDIAATNPTVLRQLTNWENTGNNVQTLSDTRVIADGPLLDIPTGTVRMAIGAQYQDQKSRPVFHDGTPETRSTPSRPRRHDSRSVKSAFTQLNIPLVSAIDDVPFVQNLNVDLSARYDRYSDFGDTTNPRFAFSWTVDDSLRIRGNISTSFNAPSLADSRDPAQVQAIPFPLARGPNYQDPADATRPTILLAGGNRNLQPQSADTWTAGVDWTSRKLDGLTAGATYWHIKVADLISVAPPGFLANPFNPAFSAFITENPSQEQLENEIAAAEPTNPDAVDLDSMYPPGPYLFLDLRRRNYGKIETSGVDLYSNYYLALDWGTMFTSFYGSYTLTRDSILPNAPIVDLTNAGFSKLQMAGTVGAMWNRLTASATVNYSQGFDVENAAPQTEVDAFYPINLAAKYDFVGNGLLQDLSVSLNVSNLLDDDAPFINTTISGANSNGQTIGRLFTVGVQKKF